MNVVGKVGSFISQGVYSVATPFHPFGGAVDVIVVQQQDGTFRSTPWYVRFGKFQGVLKGAEKMVHISVNGVEADFHMYLDNSGEAYFVKEVTSGEGSDVNGDLKDADNIEGVLKYSSNDDNLQSENDEFVVSKSDAQKQDEHISLGIDRIERTESDSERRFYEFQDQQSSLSSSVELSEYGSGRYENLDGEEHYVESQNLNSEVVLVSVDGHILTAPISSLERNTAENVQLSTPQFHLGPGQEADFCEGNADFSAGEEAWTANYLNVLGTSPQVASKDNSSSNTAISASRSQLEDSAGDEGHLCCIQGNEKIVDQERDLGMETNPEAALTSIGREDIFKSCLDIPALVNYERNSCQHSMNSAEEIHENADHSPHQFAHNLPPANEVGDADIAVSRNSDGLAPSSSCPAGNMMSPDLTDDVEFVGENSTAGLMDPCNYLVHPITHKTELEEQVKELSGENASTGHMGSDSPSVHSVTHNAELEEQFDNTLAVEQRSPQGSEDKCIGCEIIEPDKATFSASMKTDSRFEISLCGNLLHCGMGLAAAAEVFAKHQISEGDFKISAASIIKNENLVVRCRDRYLPWDKAAPIVLGAAAYGLDLPVDPKDVILVEQDEKPKLGDDSELPSIPSGRRWRLWPIPFRRVKTLEHTSSNSSNEEVFVDSESSSQNQPAETTPTSTSGNEHKQVLRTNVPTTEQIASLNLKEGQNMITFSFSTRVLGMQQVDAHIYLWKWNARIVISDVDGTITKSDVLGQFMPLVGKDWTQSGVARLFSAIKENGYQLLFLSARAIVQAYLTRSFLLNLKQDGKALPSGPVVISPDGLFPSLYREVIRRAPHEFKIACLEDIKALFPPEYNPFYAGFGNRDTDELSYRKIGIPKGKIFIINPKGEVAISQHRIDVKSYTSLHTLVNDMFPPTSMVEQEDFNSWNYWRMPLPDLD